MGHHGHHAHAHDDDGPKKSKWELVKSSTRLISYLRPYWLLAVGLLLINLVLIALGLIHPLLSKFFLDEAVIGESYGALKIIVLVVIGTIVVRLGQGFVYSYYSHRVGQEIILKLRNELYSHVQTLSVRFFERKPVGDIMARVVSDSEQVEQLIVHAVERLLASLLRLACIAGFMFIVEWRLALLAVIPMPFIIAQIVYFSPRFRGIFKNVREKFSELNTFLQERISGVRIVKSFGTEQAEATRFRQTTREYYEAFMRAVRNFSLFGPIMGTTSAFGMVMIMYWGGGMAIRKELTPGTVMAFIMYAGMFYGPIQELGRLIGHSLPRSLAAADRIFEFLDEEDKLEIRPDAIEPKGLEGRIEFQEVSFKYDEQFVLQDLTLTVEAGQTVALVGPSGVGKTTMADLVSRFYDPQQGRVLIDGVDARDYEPTALRRQIGVVLQEPFLFNTTLKENISYGTPDATDEQVQAAAQEAGAMEFIEKLENGYDTVVGERGVKLSVGEKQRISIARALIKEPAILVLDEATSSVDTPTEKVIQEALERAARDRTTILIAHRLSTTTMADRIIVLDEGAIAEQGPHAELIEREGIFAKLWRMQMQTPATWPMDPHERSEQ